MNKVWILFVISYNMQVECLNRHDFMLILLDLHFISN